MTDNLLLQGAYRRADSEDNLVVNFITVSPTAIKYHVLTSPGAPVSAAARDGKSPTGNLFCYDGHIGNSAELIEVYTSGWITCYGQKNQESADLQPCPPGSKWLFNFNLE